MKRHNESEVTSQFEYDIKEHEVQIIRDDGVNRHVRFRRPGTSCMYFDLVTWPHRLVYTGDMGDYVFSRIDDMFEFFRNARPNYSYWAEKVLASDGREGGLYEFSIEAFRENVLDYVTEYFDGGEPPEELMSQIEWEIFNEAENYGNALPGHIAMSAFSYRLPDGTEFRFDMCDLGGTSDVYTYRYMWACNAIPWAIEQYDQLKGEKDG
jgi:hypothetical protein